MFLIEFHATPPRILCQRHCQFGTIVPYKQAEPFKCWYCSKSQIVIDCFRFLIQLLIRMKFYIKSYVRLYKILCSLVFFLTSIGFIRYKVTVMVLICLVFPSWITNEFLKLHQMMYMYDESVYWLVHARRILMLCISTFHSRKPHNCWLWKYKFYIFALIFLRNINVGQKLSRLPS